MNERLQLFSIGHSNHPAEGFADLLKKHDIEVLVDVRSHPQTEDELLRAHPKQRPAIEQTDFFHAAREDGTAWKLA